jgi:predicted ester cyclase
MKDSLDRESASPVIAALRRYVTDYVNRGDFSVISEFMTDDYALHTGGHVITGRDGPYRSAVAKQMAQFPGLIFTLHELVHVGDRVAIRFTEHGASTLHGGARAAWPSIAIYHFRDDKLALCSLEQDYLSRRRQLESGRPVVVDSPAVAPWDQAESTPDPATEALVRTWLASNCVLETPGVQIDDSRATGRFERIVDSGEIEILELVSGGRSVGFHAVQRGSLAGDFALDKNPVPQQPVAIHWSGLVTVDPDGSIRGNIIRDRWGLYRRLTSQQAQKAQGFAVG